MPERDPNVQKGVIDLVLILIAVGFGMVGGITKYLADTQEHKEKITVAGMAIQAFISGFVASMAAIYLADQEFSYAMVVLGGGLSGFAGVAVLRFMTKRLFRYLGEEKLPEETHSKKGGGND